MSTSGNRSARQLLALLIGSGTASSALKKTQEEQELVIKKFIESLKTNLRSAIDANLPLIYLVDSRIIVDSMLETLNPKNLFKSDTEESERLLDIFQYFSSIIDPDSGEIFDSSTKLVSYKEELDTFTGRTKPVKVINRELLAAYTNSYNKLLSKKESLQRGIIIRINRDIGKKIKIEDIRAIISNVSSKMLSGAASVNAGTELRASLSKLGVNIVEDANTLISDYNPQYQVLVSGQSFNVVTDRVHNLATQSLEGGLNNTGLSPIKVSREGVIGFKAGNFAAAGHAGISSSKRVIGINTPQAMIASLILSLKNPTSSVDIFSDLAIGTKHKDYLIKIAQNYETLGNESLLAGFSWARSQFSVTNSKVINAEEVKLVNNTLLKALNNTYRTLTKDLTKAFDDALKEPNIANFIKSTFKMSPTLKQHLKSGLSNTLKGEKYKGPKGIAEGSLGRKAEASLVKSAKLTKSKSTAKSYSSSRILPIKIREQKDIGSLSSLLNRINGLLQQQIRKNMGTGSSRDVLNYRTGRFAQSVRVERLSESRQGMITAFYSYMKNPYATFSQGGRQQYPRSRDPKTLISKSIREIAQTMVTNQLRAVNV